jgi:hypothetical protein
MRDFRINLIFEGTSEIMRLFIAREAVDQHFALAFPIVNPESSMKERLAGLRKSAPFYAKWYPSRWLGAMRPAMYGEFGKLARHLRFADRATNKLGRALFHAMVRHGPKLERRQMILFRAVDIGAELYAIAAACVRARMLAKRGQVEAERLADVFCREARLRIRRGFAELDGRNDVAHYRLAQEVLRGEHTWLEAGIMEPPSLLAPEDEEQAEPDDARRPAIVAR